MAVNRPTIIERHMAEAAVPLALSLRDCAASLTPGFTGSIEDFRLPPSTMRLVVRMSPAFLSSHPDSPISNHPASSLECRRSKSGSPPEVFLDFVVVSDGMGA
jgi:hypothetical protein